MFIVLSLLGALLLVLADQGLKYIAIVSLKPVYTIPLIEDILHLTYVENKGMAFGLMKGQKWLLIGVTSVVLLFILFLIVSNKLKSRYMVITFSLILAGGIGNLIDRIFRSFVVDYIDFRVINFPVFNLADICVCVGLGLFILSLILDMVKESKQKKLAGGEKKGDGVES